MTGSKRRFWQIHLSTAVILMFVAGTLIGLSVLPNTATESVHYAATLNQSGDDYTYRIIDQQATRRGFPWRFSRETYGPEITFVVWDYGHLAADCVFLFALLLVTTLTAEVIVRRREARKP